MKIRVDKKKWYFAVINLVLVVLVLICAVIFGIIFKKLDSVHAAERWRGNNPMRFAQIGCYLPVDDPKSEDEILQFRRTLEQKLTDASLIIENDTVLYTDAYCGQGKLTVSGDHGIAEVHAIGVGGNFFLFHPLELCSGSYISGDDLMQDRVVLDEALAWRLFGGSNVAGMTVYINGTPFYVAGVIRRESDFASREAFGVEPGMFLSYSAFHSLTGEEITCYEIVMPDMISGFAAGIVKENFDMDTGDLVENSSRYSLDSLFAVIGQFGRRSMRHNGVIYPYWENAVRMTEDYLALLVVLMLVLGIVPAVSAVILAVRICRRGYHSTVGKVSDKWIAVRERKREIEYAKIGEK